MNLQSGFKKVSEDEKGAVLEHVNGHKINIAKSGLNKKQLRQLEKLPLHQADGTEDEIVAPKQPEKLYSEVPAEAQSVGARIAEDLKAEMMQGAANATSVETGEPIQKFAGREPVQKAPMPVPLYGSMVPYADQPTNVPGQEYAAQKEKEYADYQQQQKQLGQLEGKLPGIEAGSTVITDKSVEEPKAFAAERQPQAAVQIQAPAVQAAPPAVQPAAAQPTVAQAPQPALSNELEIQNQLYLKNLQDLEVARQKDKELLTKLEPKKVFSDASLGNKILMAISAIAGGIGAGLTGRENAALKALDDAFTRDYEAQKQERADKLNLHKLHMESLKDEMSARLQVMANMKNVAIAKMEEAEGKYSLPMAKERLKLARLTLQNDVDKIYDELARRKSMAQTMQLLAGQQRVGPGQLVKEKPATILKYFKGDEKVKEEARKEIKRREAIVANAPAAIAALDDVIKDWSGVGGQIAARTYEKDPQSLRRFRLAIRDLIPEQAGVDAQSREATVQAVLNDLVPTAFDVGKGEGPQIKQNLREWMVKNLSTPAMDDLGLNPENFESTALKNAGWLQTEQAKASGLRPNQVLVEMPDKRQFRIPENQIEAMKAKYPKLKIKVQ